MKVNFMNISSLKLGFLSYLEEKSETSTTEYNTENADISIFMYSSEFKDYLSDELNLDAKSCQMSIDDILNMEIKNGQLVDPEEEAENIADSTETTDGAEEENTTEEAAENTDADTANADTENSADTAGNDLVCELLNNIFELDDVKNIIDTDESGDLDEEEIQAFLDAIKGYDGDDENVSLEDVLSSMEAISNGEFSLAEETEELTEEEAEIEDVEATDSTEAASSTSGTSGSGGSSGGGSGSSSSGTTEKTLANMTKEELSAELVSAKSDLAEKQNVLNAILDGTDSRLQALQENIDNSYELYLSALQNIDSSFAEELDNIKTSIDAKELEISSKEKEISAQECTVSDCETAYNNAVSTRETLESSLSTLEAADTSDMDSEEKAELKTKISELESKIKEAEEAEATAKETWENAEAELDKLNDELTELQTGKGGLSELNEEKTELEATISAKYPQIQSYMDNYNNAKTEYTETKESLTTSAKADVAEAQEYVDEVQTAINSRDNKELVNEYCLNDFGEAIAELAESLVGKLKESDGSYLVCTGGKKVAWCSEFASYVIEQVMEETGTSLDGFGGMTCVNDYLKWAKKNNRYIDLENSSDKTATLVNEVEAGDVVLFNSNGSSHTGLVVEVYSDGSFDTVEGNIGDTVKKRHHDVSESRLSGFVDVT